MEKSPEIKFTLKLFIFLFFFFRYSAGRRREGEAQTIISVFSTLKLRHYQRLSTGFQPWPQTQVTVPPLVSNTFIQFLQWRFCRVPFLQATPHPSSHLPQCSLFLAFILETGRSHKREGPRLGCLYHQCYLPLEELFAGSGLANYRGSSR